jgi:hypothetical protein
MENYKEQEEVSIIKEADLKRWFKEKWVDISRKDKSGKHPECGRDDADKGAYPKCRPSKKVTKETPKTSKSLSKRDKEKAVGIKRRVEKSAPSESAGGGARKPKYTKLSGDKMKKYISKRAEYVDMPDPEENGMIKSNLATSAKSAIIMHNMIQEDSSVIPEWCQEKLAVAASMIDTVYDYLMGEAGIDMPELKD